MDTVKCVGLHPVDLSDGRTIGPGETAPNVDLADPHNAALMDTGWITPLNDTPPAEERQLPTRAAESITKRHASRGDHEES